MSHECVNIALNHVQEISTRGVLTHQHTPFSLSSISFARHSVRPNCRGIGDFAVRGTFLAAGVFLYLQSELPVTSGFPRFQSKSMGSLGLNGLLIGTPGSRVIVSLIENALIIRQTDAR